MSSKFVSLHNHTHYSILRALPSPKEIFARAKELNHSSLAITDTGTFAGMWESYKAAKETGVKLIAGGELYFTENVETRHQSKLRQIVLLATNAVGYKNLLTINRLGFDTPIQLGRKVLPIIDWKLLEQYNEGLLCLTGCGNGIISQSINLKDPSKAEADLKHLIDIFGKERLGVEVLPNAMTRNATAHYAPINQVFTNHQLIGLAKKLNLKVVPAANTHYLKKEDAETHDVLLAIGAMQPVYSNARLKYNAPDFYLKSYEEIMAFFSRNFTESFAEEMCENTLLFAEKCEVPEWISPSHSNPGKKELPVFAVKDTEDYSTFKDWLSGQLDEVKVLPEDAAYLRFKCFQAFNKRMRHSLSTIKVKEYVDRLEEELSVLNHQGFSSYMLIVSDYVNWARQQGIKCGTGRGSVGGVLCGYLLDIHKADPIRYGLIFARFQNYEKTSPPDCDCDFSADRRQEVINYIETKYGKDKVASISNFSRITPKVFARDLSRSLELGGNRQDAVRIGNNIADSISADVKNSIKFDELKLSPLFFEYLKRYPELTQNSTILGKFRGLSTHAAGLIIGQRPLLGLIPVRKDKDNNQCVEYEKENSEDNGLLKVDILGLSTLDLIDKTVKLIDKYKHISLDMDTLEFEEYDKKTYDLIASGDTFGVFQLGTSAGTIELCKRIKPRSIEDLAIITTLARPAAKNIIDDFIKTREGKRAFKLSHPSLKNAFEKTYGFGLYDESILQVGSDVAGWTLNEADRLRKMIKEKGKHPEKEAKLREDFMMGAEKTGVGKAMGAKIWDEQLSSFKSYTFNKSHAVLYSFISYITAYLKAHYPVEFLLAVLMAESTSNAPNAVENIDKAKLELRKHKVKILPPDINQSLMEYTLLDGKTLLTGLNALKFVGDDAIQDILEKRPFKSFDDFMLRCETKKVRSSAIQALAASGCLDSFKLPRKSMFLYCSDYRKKLQVWLKKHSPLSETFAFPWDKNQQEWSKPELFALEKHYIGETFVCSKKEAFETFFLDQHANITTIKAQTNKTYLPSIRAEIKSIFELKVKKQSSKLLGQAMAILNIEDEFGVQGNLTIFPEKWEEIQKRIKARKLVFQPGYAIHFSGNANLYENEMGCILQDLFKSVPPPALPKDLKAKRLSLKDKEAADSPEDLGTSDLIKDLEDQLFVEGLVDLDHDPFSLDI